MSFWDFFSSDEFMPHGHCFLWRPDLMTLHIASDAVIAISYFSIPVALIYFITKRPDVMFRSVAALFGVFILACGTTHILGIVVLWDPIYWVDGAIKAITAVASFATAILVWRLMPKAMSMPSTAQLETLVRDLNEEVASRKRAEQEVRSLNTVLEQRVRERTLELEKAVAAKEVLLQEVQHRVKNNLQIASALLAMQGESAPAELKPYLQESASRIQAMGRVHGQLNNAPGTVASDLVAFLRGLASDLARIYARDDVTVNFRLPDESLWIDFDTASSVVLILNEALNNAYKHAFPAGRRGTIEIALEMGKDGPVVTITDDGVGRSDSTPDRTGSMGMKLIRMLAGQIGATIAFLQQGGTRFSLVLPRTIVTA